MRTYRYLIVGRGLTADAACKGIRERDALQVIESGAATVRQVFDGCGARPQCARCVCDIRDMLDQAECAMAIAAE